MDQARYGAGSGRGRRMTEDVDKAFKFMERPLGAKSRLTPVVRHSPPKSTAQAPDLLDSAYGKPGGVKPTPFSGEYRARNLKSYKEPVKKPRLPYDSATILPGYVKKSVGYDYENGRQRRLGQAEIAGAGAGGFLGYKGVRGVMRDTEDIKNLPSTHDRKKVLLRDHPDFKGRGVLSLRRKPLAMIAGGLGLAGSGAAATHWSNTTRGRQWV